MVSRSRGSPAFVAVAAVVGITACGLPEKTIGPEARHVVVHAVLDLGAKDSWVRLSYSDRPQDNYNDSAFRQAIVTITTPEGIVMTGRRDSVYESYSKQYYAIPGFRVTPADYGITLKGGATYSLSIHTQAGEVVTGVTTVPSAKPVALSRGDLFHWRTDTLRLRWTPVNGAAAYFLSIDGVEEYNIDATHRDTSYRSRYSRFAFGPIDLPGTAKDQFDGSDIFGPDYYSPSGFDVAAVVAAVDTNYYQYYRRPGDPFAPALPSHLTGGLGVFGSIVPIYAKRFTVR